MCKGTNFLTENQIFLLPTLTSVSLSRAFTSSSQAFIYQTNLY